MSKWFCCFFRKKKKIEIEQIFRGSNPMHGDDISYVIG
jgi:hypothetical protein